MASTYENDLRLEEMATGENSGSWGTKTNTNLELIADAFGYGAEAIPTNADAHTTTIADGASDAGRAIYLKYTGTLDSTCTITIGPNTVSKMWFIENATSGSQDIIISQGSGANITIGAGKTKIVYSDGAGAGAAFVEATDDISVNSLFFGPSDTLNIHGDGSDSFIDETGTGNLRIRGNNIQLEQSTGGELYMQAAADGIVRLYHDGSQRLLTTTTGVQVESDSAAANLIVRSTEDGAGDGPRLDLYRDSASPADNDDIGQIYFSGENSAGGKKQYVQIDTFIESPTDGAEQSRLDVNLLSAGAGINMFRLRTDSGGANGEVVINDSSNDVDFRVESDNSQTALKVDGGTGIVSMSQGMAGLAMSGDVTFGDNDKIIMGAGSDLQLYHDGTHSYLQEIGTGNLFIASDANVNITNQATSELKATFISNGAVNLYYDNALKLATKASGIDIKFDGGGSQMGLNIHNQGTADGDDAVITFETQGSRAFAMGIDRSTLSFVIAESAGLGNARLTINDDGRVGINTATPSTTQRLHVYNAASGVSTVSTNTDLTVENSANTGISLLTPNNSNGQILFGDPEDNDVGRIQYNHPSDYMAFYTAGIENVRITNDGNIKILTSNSGTITGIGSDSRKNMVVGSTTGGEIVAYRQDNAVAGGDFIGALLFGHDDNTGTEDHFAGMWAKATSSAGVMDIHFAGGIDNYENDTPQMTLKSDGNLLVGTTDSTPYNNSAGTSADQGFVVNNGRIFAATNGNSVSILNRTNNDGDIIQFRKDGSPVGSIGAGGGALGIGSGTGNLGFLDAQIIPMGNISGGNSNGVISLGSASRRFDDIYAVNATIQTSDANEKQQIASLTDAEMTAAKAISQLFKTFKWNDSVTDNGDGARTHTGVIAQEVETAMTDAGLDAGDYAFFISTTWWETQTEVPAVEAIEAQDAVYEDVIIPAVEEVLDEGGNVLTEAQPERTEQRLVSEAVEAVEAKDAYTRTDTYDTAEEAPEGATERNSKGIRYPELLSFVGAATEQRLTSIETRLTALEG